MALSVLGFDGKSGGVIVLSRGSHSRGQAGGKWQRNNSAVLPLVGEQGPRLDSVKWGSCHVNINGLTSLTTHRRGDGGRPRLSLVGIRGMFLRANARVFLVTHIQDVCNSQAPRLLPFCQELRRPPASPAHTGTVSTCSSPGFVVTRHFCRPTASSCLQRTATVGLLRTRGLLPPTCSALHCRRNSPLDTLPTVPFTRQSSPPNSWQEITRSWFMCLQESVP